MKNKGQANRQRIIDAADQLFYHQGYTQTSFTEIAQASALNRGNFYYYFKSKDDILRAVLEQRIQELEQFLDCFDKQLNDPRERLKRFVGFLQQNANELKKYGCPFGTLSTELSKGNAELLEEARKIFDVIIRWLEKQFRQLSPDAGEPEVISLARYIVTEMQGISVFYNLYQDDAYLEAQYQRLIEWIESL